MVDQTFCCLHSVHAFLLMTLAYCWRVFAMEYCQYAFETTIDDRDVSQVKSQPICERYLNLYKTLWVVMPFEGKRKELSSWLKHTSGNGPEMSWQGFLHSSSPYLKLCNAMEMHNSFEKQDSVHRDAVHSGLFLDTCRVWKLSCVSTASMKLCAFGRRGQRLQTLTHGEARSVSSRCPASHT
jgi:hypothetical protein